MLRLIATLYPSDRAFDPPLEWWRTPLGRVVAKRVGHPSAEAVSLAETWLDQATEFARAGRTVSAWSRAEWIEQTMPVWRRLVEPVATHIAPRHSGSTAKVLESGRAGRERSVHA